MKGDEPRAELKAMAEVADAIDDLPLDSATRVVEWMLSRVHMRRIQEHSRAIDNLNEIRDLLIEHKKKCPFEEVTIVGRPEVTNSDDKVAPAVACVGCGERVIEGQSFRSTSPSCPVHGLGIRIQ